MTHRTLMDPRARVCGKQAELAWQMGQRNSSCERNSLCNHHTYSIKSTTRIRLWISIVNGFCRINRTPGWRQKHTLVTGPADWLILHCSLRPITVLIVEYNTQLRPEFCIWSQAKTVLLRHRPANLQSQFLSRLAQFQQLLNNSCSTIDDLGTGNMPPWFQTCYPESSPARLPASDLNSQSTWRMLRTGSSGSEIGHPELSSDSGPLVHRSLQHKHSTSRTSASCSGIQQHCRARFNARTYRLYSVLFAQYGAAVQTFDAIMNVGVHANLHEGV